jgi:hypothetical protein
MSTFVNTSLPKICHARVGQQVRLPDEKTGVVQPEIFMIVAKLENGCRPAREGMTQGLYDEERQLMLVSMETGVARRMPHLSSRAELLPMKEARATKSVADSEPVLISSPESVDAVVEVEMRSPRGQMRVVTVNLGDAEDTRALLVRLCTSESRVVSVKKAAPQPSTAELIEQWRKAVADGLTMQSFAEYQQALA